MFHIHAKQCWTAADAPALLECQRYALLHTGFPKELALQIQRQMQQPALLKVYLHALLKVYLLLCEPCASQCS
jgi:hypothetical protein